jgi:peptidoglycan glycosyltransferase
MTADIADQQLGVQLGRDRRRTELGLIAFAAVLIAAIYALASLGMSANLPANLVPFVAFVVGLLIVLHLAVRRLAPLADPVLLGTITLLTGFGYVMVLRLNQELAAQQATWCALATVAFVATLFFVKRARDLQRYRYLFAVSGIVLLILPMVPGIGTTINGARLWVRIGPVSFQPGEFVKITLAIFVASYLVEKRELMSVSTRRIGRLLLPDLKHFGPVVLMWGVSFSTLFVQRDLGSSALFFALFVSMLWVATGRALYPMLAGTLFVSGVLIAWRNFPYLRNRVEIWIDPWSAAQNEGFQLVQAWFALGSGGITGQGIGRGTPGRIPYIETDFIFAAIGEELGLLGTTLVLVAMALLVGSGLRAGIRSRNSFEKLLATGLVTVLGVQTFIITGGITRLLPLTGITLPFVSYGGSSLLTNFILVALLVRISHDAEEEALRRDLRLTNDGASV